jgi:ubiquinone/menaquinone biosynthesis C-methylase UbiE
MSFPEEPFLFTWFRPSAESIGSLVMASPSIESSIPQAEDEWIRQSSGFYGCPVCKRGLEPVHDGLSCHACARIYPILSGIPDFVVVNLEESGNRTLHIVGKKDCCPLLNFAASLYELWVYPAVCNLYGGWHSTSLEQLAHDVSDIVGSRDGVILDVACGPGTYGRRIASASRTVLGIDVCMSMLRQGARYVERGHIPNIHFARATVEALPFRAALFDAAICAGSLNHFSDTVLALREINRTMKVGAPLAGMCFALTNSGLFKYKSIRDRAEKGGGHIDSVADLERYVVEAGFQDFRPHAYGSVLVFSARKRSAEH